MIEASFLDIFGGADEPAVESPKDIVQLMQEMTAKPCQDCRLGMLYPTNAGLIWYGNPEAPIVVVGDMPSSGDMQARRAFADHTGNELFSWFQQAGIPKKDLFYTYIIQCATPDRTSKVASRNGTQRSPSWSEVSACFTNRAMKLIKSLPNAEVIICLGMTVMEIILGGNPQAKSHYGFWFGSDLFPGKLIFCLPHPRDFDDETSQSRRDRLRQCLLYFTNEYYGRREDGKELCPPKKALSILHYREVERKQEKAKFSIFQ